MKVLNSDILFYPTALVDYDSSSCLCEKTLAPSDFITPATGLTEPLKSTSVLEYNLVRGLIYISRRDWSRAVSALGQVISHPCKERAVSKIMTECHKKWILAGLMDQGVAPALPCYTSLAAQSSYPVSGSLYITVATLFGSGKAAELKKEVEARHQTWAEDGNASLMAEVMAAFKKWQIINLRRLYQRVSVSEVRRCVLDAETGEHLRDDETTLSLLREMMDSGMLPGEVELGGEHGQTPYLAFRDSESSLSEKEFAREAARCHDQLQWLGKQYRLADERLGGSKDYGRHVVREQKRAEMDKEADGAIGFEAQIEDEDLMTGVLAHI